ncbi:putative selenium-dependent hydroxylase accessory protein YqeC [Alkalicella caledoniensis]|uniref:Putative selenium-dependent hydroxylase accessory protein YqeC n=1 Tax=Alkalicella caledoniensis TaxID=2731377 RepID=A0A7G9W6W1_ALKCA|nr:selenium cofactor biosynthesis protein YqeC [Alkalicella caledoniensis]QNO14423.1 putative selenium-dependent hydroxylase accessory protein YqeC [Alkalicella caledoniensis]
MDIIKLLDIKPKSFITMVGGGGKTTGMFLIASQLHNCIITSTTKLYKPPINENILPLQWEGTSSTFGSHGFNKTPLLYSEKEEGKYLGIKPETANSLYEKGPFDHILCEGDGARMKALKVWKEGEPVIPSCTTHTIINIGAKVLGKTWGPETVHRSQLLPFDGLEINFQLILEMMERGVFSFNIPSTSKVYLCFNQWDTVEERYKASYKPFAQKAKQILLSPSIGLEKILFVSFSKSKVYDHI